MGWLKKDTWRVAISLAGLLLLLVLMVLIPLSASASAATSELTIVGTAQATPTVDLTVTALAKEQLTLQVKQLLQNEDRSVDAWVWNNAAAIVASFLSTLVVVIGALIGFRQWRTNRNDTLTKEATDRKESQDKELRAQAEERFKAAVTALGSENKATQVGGAILLRSFLNLEDSEIYGRYYAQIFDLAVAYLYSSNDLAEEPDTYLPLTPLRQTLINVFKEVFPLARSRLGPIKVTGDARSLDASRIQLDGAFLAVSDLKYIWMQAASLRNANLIHANLVGAFLFNADLDKTDLTGADLTGAILSKSNLCNIQLNEAKLIEASLQLVDFTRANLKEADLHGANLSNSNLEKARSLKNTNLRGVTGLTIAQLEACKAKGAIVDEDIMGSSPDPTIPP